MSRLSLFVAAMLLLPVAAAAEPFRIIVTSTEVPLVPNSVLHLAKSEGYFDRAGVDVELIAVEQTPMAIAALRSKGGDMANISVDGLFGLYTGGVTDLKAVGSTDKSIPYIIAGRQGLALKTLAGQRFGVGRRNSLDHTLSWNVLNYFGADANAVDYLPLGQPSVRAQALSAGQIDATTMSIGVFLSMPDHDRMTVLADVAQYYDAAPVLSKVNVVHRETIASRAGELEKVLEALTLAARDYAGNPDKWVAAMRKSRPDVEPAVLAQLAEDFRKIWTVNGGIQRAEMDFTQEWLYRLEKFENSDVVVPGAWADFGPIDRVLARIGKSNAGDAVSR
jgi:NitT/TauT family transport system substrate-binding protein